METKVVTQRVIRALERVWIAEINGRLPFQSKARIYRDLSEDGTLLAPMQRTFGSGWSTVTVTGYELTRAGRFIYCESCRDESGLRPGC